MKSNFFFRKKQAMKTLLFLATVLVANFSIAQEIKIKKIKEHVKGVSKTKREYLVLDIDKEIKQGYYKEFYKKDLVVSGTYKLDKKEGDWVYKDPEGNYIQKGSYHNGKK